MSSKKNVKSRRAHSKSKKIRKMERQDAKEISRNLNYKRIMEPKLFIRLKIISVLIIPIVYFVYSPFLIFCMCFSVFLFFGAIWTENYLNKSYIKANHIKIPKFDSAIALLVIVVAIVGMCINSNSNVHRGHFENSFIMDVKSFMENTGSLLTGKRELIRGNFVMKFAMKEPPEGFVPDASMMQGKIDQMGGPKNFKMDIGDLPIEFLFSSILSTVNTVLIFSISVLGVVSLYIIYRKRKKFEMMLDEVIYDEKVMLDEAEIERLLSFGEIEEKSDDTIKQDL